MTEKPMTEALARRFLLGQVDDRERQEIERLFLVDSEAKNTVLLAEESLIEDYLDGALTESDAAEFLLRHAHTARQRRKLRIAESIRQYALAATPPATTALSGVPLSGIQRLRNLFSSFAPGNRRYFIPVTLTATIVLLVTGVWFVQWYNRGTHEANLHPVIERELSELNSRQSLGQIPPQMLAKALPPLTLRSAQPASEIRLQAGYVIIELQLLWPQKEEYQSYKATLRRIGSPDEFTVADLQLEKNLGNNVVKLRLPAQHIAPGLYQINLSGVINDGAAASAEEYVFTVTR